MIKPATVTPLLTKPQTIVHRLRSASIDDGVSEPVHPSAHMALHKEAANEIERLKKVLRELTYLCDHVPVFKLDDGGSGAVRMAVKFMDAMKAARATLQRY